MKKTLLFTLIAALLLTGAYVQAASVQVNRLNNDHIEPLVTSDFIQARYFNATSTTATSTFAGDIYLTTGNNAVTHYIATSDSGSTPNLTIKTGNASSGTGGSLSLIAGNGLGGGAITLTAGNSIFTSSNGADVTLNGGTGTALSGNVLLASLRGNVGIGTNSPTEKLVVSGGNVQIGAYAAGYAGSPLKIQVDGSTGTGFVISNSSTEYTRFVSGGVVKGLIGYGTIPFEIGSEGPTIFTDQNSTNERMRITSGGNVGIGTTTPGTLLSIGNTGANTINISPTGTSTWGSGQNLRTGCYAINSTCIGGSNLTGSGAANRAAFWTATGNLSYSDNFVWDNSNGRLGIGTTNPVEKLQVQGNIRIEPSTSASIGSGTYISWARESDNWNPARIEQLYENAGYNGALAFLTNTGASAANITEKMRLTAAGNLGIGTTSPKSRLTVKGDIGTDGAIPTLSSAGSSPSITVGSTDTAGEITEGTVATGATITFAAAKTNKPFCTVTSESGLAFSYTVSTTAITIINIGALSGSSISYICINNDL